MRTYGSKQELVPQVLTLSLRLHDLLNDIADGILLSGETDGTVTRKRENFQLFLQQVNLTSLPKEDVPIFTSTGHTAPVTASLTAAAFTQVESECDASHLKAVVINQGDIFEGLDNTTVVSVVLTVDLGDCVVEGQEEVIRMTFSNVQRVSVFHHEPKSWTAVLNYSAYTHHENCNVTSVSPLYIK